MSRTEDHGGERPGNGGSLAHRVPDLGALELLLAVARVGSLGRAARELGITQPAASSRIRSMERQLGVALVDRSPRGSRLTDAGALVTDWARRIVEAAEVFDAGAQALRDRRDSRLRVAASMTIAELLTSQRRAPTTRCSKFLAGIGMPETKTVGSMTERQRSLLATLI